MYSEFAKPLDNRLTLASLNEAVQELQKTVETVEEFKRQRKVEEPKHVQTRKLINELKQSMEQPKHPLGPYEIRQPLSDDVIRAKLGMIADLEGRLKLEIQEHHQHTLDKPSEPSSSNQDDASLLKRIEALELNMQYLKSSYELDNLVAMSQRSEDDHRRQKINQEISSLLNIVVGSVNRLMELNVKNN